MSKDIYIVVEGIADKNFLSSYIDHLELKLNCYEITVLYGFNEKKIEKAVKEIPDNKTIIAIIDANSDRDKNIEIACEGLKIKKEQVFTFPDNIKNGTLEDLLKKICVGESFFKCFDNYQKCLTNAKLKEQDKKTKIYSYDKAVGGAGKEAERDYNNSERYNLRSPELEPLKKFLTNYL